MARKSQNSSTSRAKSSTRAKTAPTASRQPSPSKPKPDSAIREVKAELEPLMAPGAPSNEQNVSLKQSVELQQNRSEPNKEQSSARWIALQGEVDRLQGECKQLQQTCSEQGKIIDKLEGEIAEHNVTQSGYQKRYVTLQEECIVQAQTIEKLQEEVIALKAQINQQVAEQTSEQLAMLKVQMEQQLKQQLSEQISQLSARTTQEQKTPELQQQIAVLKGEIERQVMDQMRQQQRYEVLHRQSQEQAHLIAELRELVTQEQRYSAIGEAHLNKWRYRTFSS